MPRQRHEARLEAADHERIRGARSTSRRAVAGVARSCCWMRRNRGRAAFTRSSAVCVFRRGKVLECLRPVSMTLQETLFDPPCCVNLRLHWRLEPLELGRVRAARRSLYAERRGCAAQANTGTIGSMDTARGCLARCGRKSRPRSASPLSRPIPRLAPRLSGRSSAQRAPSTDECDSAHSPKKREAARRRRAARGYTRTQRHRSAV